MNAITRDDGLLNFATDRQKQLIESYWQHKSFRTAADELGVHHTLIVQALDRVKGKAAKQGYAPDHDMKRTAPDGFSVKGVSTLYKADGEIAAQWVKTSIDRERQSELMREAVEAMCKDIKPVEAVPAPQSVSENLLNAYTITDYHMGMKSWSEETGADYDTDIAEKLLKNWFGAAIAQAPAAKTCVLAQLGDFLHYDGIEAVTPTSKHIVDSDTRFQKVIRVTIATVRRVIEMLLRKHEKVIVLMAEGNHDISSSMWLREMFAALYSNEPRVEVITSPDPYYCIEWGKTSLFYHHGHKKNFAQLETVFVAKFREIFGRTKHSYAHTGHLHHVQVKETNTMILEQHRTLAAPDSHASRGGWLSGRDAKVITYHREYGEVSRATISVDMVNEGKGYEG